MSVQILRGNALALPLADDSVDLVVTSPPYFGLRSYQDGGSHYDGQIGSEATPTEFVDALIAATREMVRVVKPSGSIWVNLGDRYSGGSSGQSNLTKLGERLGTGGGQKQDSARMGTAAVAGMRPKSLIGIPWRYALRCIDDLGLILRAEVIWSKPNGLPESVTDRVRRSHETWFHFTLNPRYYSAVDEIREEHAQRSLDQQRTDDKAGLGKRAGFRGDGPNGERSRSYTALSPLGKLPGSVWTIATQPLTVPPELGVDHFAAFPMEWPRRIVTGWSPREVCTACGEGRRPVGNREHVVEDMYPDAKVPGLNNRNRTEYRGRRSVVVGLTGYACACPDTTAPATPGTVLDPFGGTGTTALVAHALGRHGISVDMSSDYCRLAEWRTTDPSELARAMQLEKPAQQVRGQESLFDLGDAS